MGNKKLKPPVDEPKPMAIEGELVSSKSEAIGSEIHPVAQVLNRFLRAMDDYRDAVLIAIPVIVKTRSEELKKTNSRIERFVAQTNDDGSKLLKAKCAHDIREMSEAIQYAEKLNNSNILAIVVKSIFIGMFSEYDSFIGDLLKSIYFIKPSLYKGIKREISLNDLLNFGTIDEIKRDMLEKEIDTFRRDSYVEQFSELEKKFEIRTLKAFPEWSIFVEMGQRRNLMTHNDGRVSPQYIQICTKEGVEFQEPPLIGSQLNLTGEYMGTAMLALSKVAFMLAHTLWRKVSPADIDVADKEMTDAVYDLLQQKRWRTAAAFSDFSLTDPMKKNLRDMDLRIRIINSAIAQKQLKNKNEVNRLLTSVDWSASIREFNLAKAVLEEKYSDAAELMKNIGKHGEILDEVGYHRWPLFSDFRGTVEFQEAYENIFGTPFGKKVSETVPQKEDTLNEQPKKSAHVQKPRTPSKGIALEKKARKKTKIQSV